MAELLTIPETIAVGDVSTYLAGNDNSEGSLFGARIALVSPITIATVTDALRWQYEGDMTDSTLRGTANYLYWLCGKYQLEAQRVIDGNGGGVVIPGGGSGVGTIYPFIITSIDFEADGISYDNPLIVGDLLSIFVNEFSQQWLTASGTTFSYTATGIQINIPGFDASTQDWTIMIQKLNS